MAVYPAFAVTCRISGHAQTRAGDPTIRTPFEAGYTQTRPRFTRVPRRWTINYDEGNALTSTEKATLEAFEAARGVGGEAFTWTNPFDGVAYTVRLAGPIQFAPVGTKLFWSARFDVEEV